MERVIDKINQRCSTVDTSRLPALTSRLQGITDRRKKLIALHMNNLINEGELTAELTALNERKADLERSIATVAEENQASGVSKDEIREVIKNLSLDIRHASPGTLWIVFNKLFQEIKISSKRKKFEFILAQVATAQKHLDFFY